MRIKRFGMGISPHSIFAKMMSWFAALLFFFSNLTYVNAAPVLERTILDAKAAVTHRLHNLCISTNSYLDDRGMCYSLMSLSNCIMWYDFSRDFTKFDFNKNEIQVYADYIATAITKFSGDYGHTSEKLKHAVSLELKTSEDPRIAARLNANNVLQVAGETFRMEYDDLADQYNKLSTDEDKKAFLEKDENRSVIKAVYEAVVRIGQEHDDILSLCRMSNIASGGAYDWKLDISKISAIITDSKYAPFVEWARKLVELDLSTEDDEDGMSGDSAYDKYLSEFDGKNQVNAHWLKVMACSTVYRPFESTVGEVEFIEALKSLDSDKEAEKTYTGICKRKKPIYWRKYTKDEKGTGIAKRISVKDFMDYIQDDDQGVLVTVKGKFGRSTDSDMFSTYQNKGTAVYDDNGEKVTTNEVSKKEKKKDENQNEDDEENTDEENTDEETDTEDENAEKNVHMEDDDGNEFVIGPKISDLNLLTDPVFTYGSDSPRATMNKVMMYNFFKDSKVVENFENLDSRLLYINPFGDIVLDDDTVVIPAAANATFYSDSDGIVYNPNTAAFMNSYPRASLNSEYFQTTDRDSGKYLVGMGFDNSLFSEDGSVDNGEEGSPANFEQGTIGPTITVSKPATAYIIGSNEKSLRTTQIGDKAMPIELQMFNSGSSKISTMRIYNFKYNFSFFGMGSSLRTVLDNICLVVPDTSTLLTFSNQTNVFPLVGKTSDDDYIEKCKTLVTKFYNEMRTSDSGDNVGLNDRYKREFLTEIFKAGYDGSDNIAIFTKNCTEEFTTDAKSAFPALTTTLILLANKTLEVLGKSGGVIGIQDAYQDAIFGKFLYVAKDYLPLFLAGAALIIIRFFAKKRIKVTIAIFAFSAFMFLTYLMLLIIPVYLPNILNFCINNTSEDIAYRALFMREEKYENPFEFKSGYDERGNFIFGTSSVNLYRLHDEDIDYLCRQVGCSKENLMSGKSQVLDENSGLFLEGDFIKINLDRMFSGLSITGGYNSKSVTGAYEITSKKYISSVLDYYTPWHQFVDAFIGKLNKLSALYNIPSSQLHYAGDVYKDSFIVNTYTKSDLFLHGDNLQAIEETSGTALYEQAISPTYFGQNNLDFLGISDVLVKAPSEDFDSVKDTLWFQEMVRKGIYDSDGAILDEEELGKIISAINLNTQKFMIENQQQMAYISDENLIKGISLFAVCLFNQKISEFTDVVYPVSLNYETLKLEDVMLPVMTKDYDRYMARNQKIVSYIYADFGSLGVILFMIICVESYFIVNIMKLCLPVLYILLLIIFFIRICLKWNDKIKVVFVGYLKVFGSIFGSYVLYCLSTATAYNYNDSALTLFVLCLLYSVYLTVMGTVLFCLLSNLIDFGNSSVNSTIKSLSNKLMHKLHLESLVNRSKEAIQRILPGRPNIPDVSLKDFKNRYDSYRYSASADDFYGDELFTRTVDMRLGEQPKNYSAQGKVKLDKKHLRRKEASYSAFGDDLDDIEALDEYNDRRYR